MVFFFIIILLSFGKILTGTNKIWYGKSNSTPIELITTLNLEENVGSSGGNGYPSDEFTIIELGNYVYFKGYEWLVCHEIQSTRTRYLITKDLVKTVQWNTTKTTTGGYAASNIKKECDQFAKDTGIDQLDYVVDTGVGKVFIPTKDQLSGQLGFLNVSSNRVSSYITTSQPEVYWTATPIEDDDGYLYRVDNIGNVIERNSDGRAGANKYNGFRPCICIQC